MNKPKRQPKPFFPNVEFDQIPWDELSPDQLARMQLTGKLPRCFKLCPPQSKPILTPQQLEEFAATGKWPSVPTSLAMDRKLHDVSDLLQKASFALFQAMVALAQIFDDMASGDAKRSKRG
jgi:hypothetical protein